MTDYELTVSALKRLGTQLTKSSSETTHQSYVFELSMGFESLILNFDKLLVSLSKVCPKTKVTYKLE